MSQLDVEASSHKIEVTVEGRPFAEVALPRAIDDDAARAKFVKKAGELRVRAPYA